MHARGRGRRHVELPCLTRLLLIEVQPWWMNITGFEVTQPTLRVLEPIARLPVAVDLEPLLPAGVAVARCDLRIEIEPIAVLEANTTLVDRLYARAATQRQARRERRQPAQRGSPPPAGTSAERVSARGFSHDFCSH